MNFTLYLSHRELIHDEWFDDLDNFGFTFPIGN